MATREKVKYLNRNIDCFTRLTKYRKWYKNRVFKDGKLSGRARSALRMVTAGNRRNAWEGEELGYNEVRDACINGTILKWRNVGPLTAVELFMWMETGPSLSEFERQSQ